MVKRKIAFIVCLFFIMGLPVKAQFEESKARKKMWQKSSKRRKNREAFNPYLDKKRKPSQELSQQNAKDQKRQLKAARKQKRRSMKKMGIKPSK